VAIVTNYLQLSLKINLFMQMIIFNYIKRELVTTRVTSATRSAAVVFGGLSSLEINNF
jgi:hypothetical protein